MNCSCISWFMGTSDVMEVFNFAIWKTFKTSRVAINHEMHEQFMRFFVYYILNKITPCRYFTRLGRTLLETPFNGFQNARTFCLKRNYNNGDRQTKPKIVS